MAPDALALLAGFVLAHAAWSLSDLPEGQALVPLAVVEAQGQRQLLRFEAPTQEQAIARGKAAMAERQAHATAWAFGREGLMAEGAGKADVLTIDAWASGMARPIAFVQRFRRQVSGGFRIRGDALVVVDGRVREGPEAARLVQALYAGALQHPKAGPLWPGWRAP